MTAAPLPAELAEAWAAWWALKAARPADDPELEQAAAAVMAAIEELVPQRLGDLVPSDADLGAMSVEEEAQWAGIEPEMTPEQEAWFAGVPLLAPALPRIVRLPRSRLARPRARTPRRSRRRVVRSSRLTRAGPDGSEPHLARHSPAAAGRLGVDRRRSA